MTSLHPGAVDLPATLGAVSFPVLGLAAAVVLIFLFQAVYFTTRYKRCPSNKVMVIFGKVPGEKSSRCLHGGGALILPLIQDYAYLSLEPITVEFKDESAASKENEPVTFSARYTVAISTKPDLTQNAAERLLNLDVARIETVARDVILGQIRQTLARIPVGDMKQDRAGLVEQINSHVANDLNKLGLEIISMNLGRLLWETIDPGGPVAESVLSVSGADK